jgi:hypothetical protein
MVVAIIFETFEGLGGGQTRLRLLYGVLLNDFWALLVCTSWYWHSIGGLRFCSKKRDTQLPDAASTQGNPLNFRTPVQRLDSQDFSAAEAHEVSDKQSYGLLLQSFQQQIRNERKNNNMKHLSLSQYFVPRTNMMQLISFFFFWANITAISFVPDIDWGISEKAYGIFWRIVGKFLMLTLFDFNLALPNLPWLPDFFRVQFGLAVTVSIMFPFGAVKYYRFLRE